MFEIEKNIPAPEGARRGPKTKYPLSTMDVGDSFFVPTDNTEKQHRLLSASWQKYHLAGKRFTARKEDGGVRVWRTQ